jgi:transcriptional regulator with XRE-family HTH domain
LAEDDDLQTRRAIGRAARAARNALRFTQEQVADALGMAAEVYGRIERGLMMPSVSTLIGIAKVLRITPDQLLGWNELQERTRPAAYERILAHLDRADESTLERADAVLSALLAPEAKK